MKNIYQFKYQFRQDKRGLLNYKTYIIIDGDPKHYEEHPLTFLQCMQAKAEFEFKEKFPHVDFDTVEVSEFRGDMIDSCEPV